MKEFIKRVLSSIILIPLSIYSIISGSLIFNLFVILFLLISLYEWHEMSKFRPYELYGYFYLFLSFYSFYSLNAHFEENFNYIFMIISICVLTDIGGYFFGNLFKGPKLTKISPKKTLSGVIGGFFFPLIFLFFNRDKFNVIIDLEIKNFILFIIIISLISQLGDLTISYFKRLSKIKDTGKIIPGHGGLLDRIDGMIFVFPFAYLILKFDRFFLIL